MVLRGVGYKFFKVANDQSTKNLKLMSMPYVSDVPERLDGVDF
jgi:hypothetical protein